MNAETPVARSRWVEAWPDALAFAVGLGLAWWLEWATTDLVWSLWLSSLVVGYASNLWGAAMPAVVRWREGNAGGAVVAAAGGVFAVAFFTVHFGIFHAVHAAFLNSFFPVGPAGGGPGLDVAAEVVRRYGWFLPVALLAERRGFRVPQVGPEPPRTSVKASDIAVRKARQSLGAEAMFRPYVNVVRMHLLIFFFAAVHYAKAESFAVYAVVYAVYFFPWRLLARSASTAERS